MTSAAPMGAETTAPAPTPRRIGMRATLAALAFIEAWIGFSDMPALFGDTSNMSGFGGGLIKAHLAAHPLLAIAALVFAGLDHVRHAIIALGTIIIMTWLGDLPSVVAHGLEFKSAFSTIETTARIIVFPLAAACAIAYAARNEQLARATLLVAVPTLFNIVLLVGFVIGVLIYGF